MESRLCILENFRVGFGMFPVGHSVHSESRCQETSLQDTTSCLHLPLLAREPVGRAREHDCPGLHRSMDFQQATKGCVVETYELLTVGKVTQGQGILVNVLNVPEQI